jgi:hypothetical protein
MFSFKSLFVFAVCLACISSCSIRQKERETTDTATNTSKNSVASRLEAAQNTTPSPSVSNNTSAVDTDSQKACLETATGDDVVMQSQTFPIDFAPFARSCFVTTYNPEYDDPPMESRYSIYKNDKKVFDFPDQFNGATFGCWVDGVSFQDLNNDKLKDVIVVGKCSTKGGQYNENMVYINTGKAFVTRPDGNNRISDFTKIKEITDFVHDNQQIFFP